MRSSSRREASCVNIFNGEAPPTAVNGIKRLHSNLAEWKQILGNQVGNEDRSRAWCKRALLRIYANQERDEQLAASTTKRNGIGFTPADAKLLSGLAEQLKQSGWLSTKQWEVLYKAMPKYAGQLRRGVGA